MTAQFSIQLEDDSLRKALTELSRAADRVLGMDLDLIGFNDLDELALAQARACVALGEGPPAGYAITPEGKVVRVEWE